MKAKQGYKQQKPRLSTGKWLKRYFVKNTCRRKSIRQDEKLCPDNQ